MNPLKSSPSLRKDLIQGEKILLVHQGDKVTFCLTSSLSVTEVLFLTGAIVNSEIANF